LRETPWSFAYDIEKPFLAARLPLIEMRLEQQAAFLQQLERAVDRGIADLRVDLFDLGIKLLARMCRRSSKNTRAMSSR
jgi:hypothetical protein